MVASNMGITILPATAAESGAYQGNILTTRPLKASSPNRVVALAWRKSFPRVKAVDLLLDAVSKCQLLT
jgi:LysR family hydrogen peroxide-inducible transcriptional activator